MLLYIFINAVIYIGVIKCTCIYIDVIKCTHIDIDEKKYICIYIPDRSVMSCLLDVGDNEIPESSGPSQLHHFPYPLFLSLL